MFVFGRMTNMGREQAHGVLQVACRVAAYLGVTEGREIQGEREGHSPLNLAEAAAHVLLEALHMHRQQWWKPTHSSSSSMFAPSWMHHPPALQPLHTIAVALCGHRIHVKDSQHRPYSLRCFCAAAAVITMNFVKCCSTHMQEI